MRALFLLAAAAVAASVAAAQARAPAKAGAQPAIEAITRDFPVAAARAKSPGEAAFLARCQYCHVEMGFGTLTLMKRLGPQQALLANRTDLAPDYVRTVVRHGLNGMPPLTRTEVSDAELQLIVGYLTRKRR